MTCTPKSDDLPEGILNKEVMIDVITDLQLLDAAQRSFSTGSIETSKMRDTSYAIVFNKYEITKSDYDSSFRSYARHPEVFSQIMDQVSLKLRTLK